MQDYLEKLNPSQREAATTTEGTLRIIAGAGSGKTSTLIARLAYLIDKGVNPEEILLLTFTNAAAKEMKKRASALSSADCAYVTASTFHSFCASLLRTHASAAGIPYDFVILSEGEACDAVKMIKADLGYSKMRGFPKDSKIVKALSWSTNTGASLIESLRYCQIDEFANEIAEIVDTFTIYKADHGLLDYDDLLVKVAALLENDEQRIKIASKYKYVMIDEFQDTNTLQERISMGLSSVHGNLAVVGDDYQSIYAFRGANVNNILDLPIIIPACKTVILSTNYRSTDQIVSTTNALMDTHANFGVPKDMEAEPGKTGSKPKKETFPSQKDETDAISAWLIKLTENPDETAAVLSRTSRELFPIEAELNKAGIPYEKLGGAKFSDLACIRDILAYCRVVVNPSDELSWYRLLDVMPGVGEIWAKRIVDDLGTENFMTNPDYSKRSFAVHLKELSQIIAMIRKTRTLESQLDLMSKHYFKIRKHKINIGDFADESNRTAAYEQLNSDKESIEVLLEIAMRYSSLNDFIDDISLDALNPEPENPLQITLSTVHSAKGLEWDHVSVMNVCDEFYPPIDGSKAEKEESLRLLYVAMTRAKTELVVNISDEIRGHGCQESPFLQGLDKFFKESKKETPKDRPTVYLSVPFSQKDYVKSLGAKWDYMSRSWYVDAYSKGYDELVQTYGAGKKAPAYDEFEPC